MEQDLYNAPDIALMRLYKSRGTAPADDEQAMLYMVHSGIADIMGALKLQDIEGVISAARKSLGLDFNPNANGSAKSK